MTAIVGLDVSCNATGVALPSGRCLTARPRTTDIGPRLRWVAEHVDRHLRTYRPALVVLEDYAPRSVGILSTIRVAEVGGVVRLALTVHAVPWVSVSPSQLKRYACGHGNAAKEQVVEAARAAGADVDDDNQADAWWLRAIGRQAIDGRDVDPFAAAALATARLDIVSSIDWPRIT